MKGAFVLLCLALSTGSALGQDTDEAPRPPAAQLSLDERRRELAELTKRLTQLRARYEATRKKISDLSSELEAASLKLEIKTGERRKLELEMAEAERAAVDAKRVRDGAATDVAGLQESLAERLGALYRMGRLGYLRTMAAVESGRTFLRGLQTMQYLAERDARLLSRYQEALATLAEKESALSTRQKELVAITHEARQREAELVVARKEKADLLARARRTEAAERTQLTSLEEKSGKLAALLDLLETRGRALPPGAASIRKFRGALDWPAKGRVVVPFGRIENPKFPGTYLRSSGFTLDVPPGTEVRAIFAGDVVFAQWLKGYGNLVVLDHGDGVFSVYGRLGPGTIPRGERAGVGDRVGILGESPEDEVPGLYFEIREARSSVDPSSWLR